MGLAGVRHFATEQLVEGVVLGRTGRLRPAEEWFAHYWGNRSGYDAEIARRLADAFIEGLSVKEAAARYRERPIDLAGGSTSDADGETATLDGWDVAGC